jgi:hypothetical protein
MSHPGPADKEAGDTEESSDRHVAYGLITENSLTTETAERDRV